MWPRVVSVDPQQPRRDRLAPAVEALNQGGIVALPTETVYGLAVDPFQPGAVRRLNRFKGKSADAPALLLLAGEAQLALVARELDERFRELAARFWPGPLTLVVRAAPGVPDEVSGGRGTVALRVPGLALPREVAAALGRPITGVSANPHGARPARTASEVARLFEGREGLSVILDGGPSPGSQPSTLVDLTGSTPRLLREGAIPRSALEPFLEGLDAAG